jgi:hypothetical protein
MSVEYGHVILGHVYFSFLGASRFWKSEAKTNRQLSGELFSYKKATEASLE